MAYRQIHTKIWKDAWFLDLAPDGKLLFFYLCTNERTNILGLYDLPLKVIAFETDLDPDTIRRLLADFEKAGKVYYDSGWVWVKNLMRYNAQNVESPKVKAHIQATIAELPEGRLKTLCLEHNGLPIPYPDRIDTLPIPIPQEPSDQEQEQEPSVQKQKPVGSSVKKGGRAQPSPDLPPNGGPPSESEHHAIFAALQENVYRYDGRLMSKDDRVRLGAEAKLLCKAGYTSQDVSDGAREWWQNDWRGKKGSPPLPKQFRELLGRLRKATALKPQEVQPWQ